MIHGPICRIRHVGYDKICGCLIVYHPIKDHVTPSDNVVRESDVFNFHPTPTNFVEWANQSNDRYLYTWLCLCFCVYVHVLI